MLYDGPPPAELAQKLVEQENRIRELEQENIILHEDLLKTDRARDKWFKLSKDLLNKNREQKKTTYRILARLAKTLAFYKAGTIMSLHLRQSQLWQEVEKKCRDLAAK